jgi:AhpD family alkylhydroperoxidase
MHARMRNPAMIIPGSMEPLLALGAITKKGAPAKVLGLLHLRVSQINGCAACLDMHLRVPRDADETPERLITLAAWRESPYFTPAERAALALAEQITHIDREGVTDPVWQEAARHFDEPTLATIVLYVATVNLYNRVNVATKQVAGPQDWERRKS